MARHNCTSMARADERTSGFCVCTLTSGHTCAHACLCGAEWTGDATTTVDVVTVPAEPWETQ